MLFTKTSRRSAMAACEKRAQQIARSSEAMGLEVIALDKSRVSASTYVTVCDAAGDALGVRVSDHPDYHGGNDLHVYADERAESEVGGISWFEAVEKIATYFNRDVPSAAKAARTRAANAAQAYAESLASARASREQRDTEVKALEQLRKRHDPEGYAAVSDLSGRKARKKRTAWRRRVDNELIALGYTITDDYNCRRLKG